MNLQRMKRITALALAAAAVMSVNAGALFGWGKQAEEPAEGAPIAQELSITTYRGIPYRAQFLASDSEGEDISYAVDTPPRKGTVVIDGAEFIYTPDEGITGGDSFTYTATDSAGNTSLPAKVTIQIEKTRSGVTYRDTEDPATAAAAQHLAEAGIFTGTRIGSTYCFEPERPVTRGEFLAMVLETCGREVSEVTMTGFCDDQVIPTWAKAYAAAGVADGVIRGTATDEGVAFRGSEAITFNEAATVLNRVLDLEDVDLTVWYTDRETVPSWAAQAVGNLEAVSVMAVGSFGSGTLEEDVTRGEAAKMLSAAKTLLDEGAAVSKGK